VSGASLVEREIFSSILSELRTYLFLDICLEPAFERGFRQPRSEKRRVDYLVIGSSHSLRASAGLNKQGSSTLCIHSAGCRVTATSVADMVANIKETAATASAPAAVLQLLDNSVFFGRSEDGGLRPASRGEDEKFPLMGELEVAGKERQHEVLSMLLPILEQLRDMKVIFMCPMPGYYLDSCCEDRSHVSNRFQRSFKEEIINKLEERKTNIKNFMFMNRMRNVITLDPGVDLKRNL
jgi:hypothetical protein